jgi:hypothetical protein
MLLTPSNSFNYYVTNAGAPSLTPGTSVAGNATANVEGAWTQLVAATAADIYWFSIAVTGGAAALTYRSVWLDIGVDNAGGSSYTAIINNLLASESSTSSLAGGGLVFYFPMFIKAGSTIAARVQTNTASTASRVVFEGFGRPNMPHLVQAGTFSETIGNGTAPSATAFTPGNSGANGAWASLGTTTNDLFWVQLGVQCSNVTITALAYNFDVAYGNGTDMVMLIEDYRIICTTTESIGQFANLGATARCQTPIPTGSTLYVRGSCSGTAVTGWQASVVGVG